MAIENEKWKIIHTDEDVQRLDPLGTAGEEVKQSRRCGKQYESSQTLKGRAATRSTIACGVLAEIAGRDPNPSLCTDSVVTIARRWKQSRVYRQDAVCTRNRVFPSRKKEGHRDASYNLMNPETTALMYQPDTKGQVR